MTHRAWVILRWILPAVAILILAFLLGVLLQPAIANHWRWQTVQEALASLRVNVITPRTSDPVEREYYYYPSRFSKSGVLRHDPALTMPGLTLFSSVYEPAAYLIDQSGKMVHKWKMPFSEAWPAAPHIELPVPDKFIFFRKTHVFPNGDLLAIYEAPGHWPYAYGLIKLNSESQIIWRYPALVNHHLDVAPDGRIYTLVHESRNLPQSGLENLTTRNFIDDVLVVLDADGKEEVRISIVDAFARSKYAGVMDGLDTKDVLHTNSLQIVTQALAEQVKVAKPGQILLSNLTDSVLSVLDLPSKSIVWARRGSWRKQHSAHFTSNGGLVLFDNKGRMDSKHKSRILEIDPRTGAEVWAFSGEAEAELVSENRGSVQPLENGNYLITESNSGRLLEVTRDKKVVWEYVVGHAQRGKSPSAFEALRIDLAGLKFLPAQ